MPIDYPDRHAALAAYAEAVEVSREQAQDALLDVNGLESALARPRHAATHENADLVRQAATLFWGLAADHSFRDGNKRTAVLMLRAFLLVNDHDHTLGEDAIFELALAVADGRWSVRDVEAALRPAVVPDA